MDKLIPPISSVYVLLGIVFVMALLGILAAVLFEIIATFLNLRGKAHKGMVETLFKGDADLLEKFCQHPMYQVLLEDRVRSNKRALSWLSSQNFVLILMDVLEGNGADFNDRNFVFSKSRSLNWTLQKGLEDFGEDKAKFYKFIENWYNEKADYTFGAFKRTAQTWLVFIAVFIAILFNADIGSLYKNISNSLDAPKTTVINDLTEDLGKLVKMDSSLVQAREVEEIKRGLLVKMNEALQYQPAPILGHHENRMQQSFSQWIFYLLGMLVSGLAIAFAAQLWYEWLKRYAKKSVNDK